MKHSGYFTAVMVIIGLLGADMAVSATKKPATIAELAFYKGPDRQQILEEGAKKEGTLIFYTSGILTQAVRPIVDSFEKKYPYIKVEIWRAGSEALVPRVFEEAKAGKLAFDVIENTQTGYLMMQEQGGILQPFTSPNFAFMEEDAITKAPGGGAYRVAFRESGHSIGYNTKLLPKDALPKTYRDLLDPKWKGKVAIAGSENGVSFVGNMLGTYGIDFVKRLASQNFDVHMVSARAILDMIINGEYLLSPTITDAHVSESKQQGAPVDWVPLDPVHVNAGQIGLCTQARHPYAAMLFIDHELSKESGEIHKAKGYISPRKDVAGEKTYKKNYGPYTIEESKRWRDTFQTYFTKR
jgi:iron(III) transport system substrate-binding protein